MMNVDTGQRFDRETIIQLSQSQQEPDWMLQRRSRMGRPVNCLPKPEKTRIDHWNFTDFQPVPEEEAIWLHRKSCRRKSVRYISGDETDNLFIQKNSSPIFCRLSWELLSSREFSSWICPLLSVITGNWCRNIL